MKKILLFILLFATNMQAQTICSNCPKGIRKQGRCAEWCPVNQPVPPTDTVITPPPVDTTKSSFDLIRTGIRPRGFGTGTYTLDAAKTGRVTYYVSPNGSDINNGSAVAPFKTINKSAQVAIAGDVVIIQNGTYQESVFVANSGTSSAPIVFQAQNRGGVVLTGNRYIWTLAYMNVAPSLQYRHHIKIKGLIFRDYAPNEGTSTFLCGAIACPIAAVFINGNATIEDCLFERAGNNGIQIWGRNNTITRTTFKDNWTHAFASWGPSGNATTPSDPNYIGSQVSMSDVIMHGNNVKNVSADAATSSSVAKFTMAKGMVIDNIESYNNRGHGLWFDAMATDYVVRNSYFHDNDASGLDLEISWGGLVENNVFERNLKTGLYISNTEGVEVRNNLFYLNPTGIEIADWLRDFWRVKNLNIHHNFFKGTTKVQTGAPAAAIYHAVSYFPTTTPQSQNIIVNYNTYDRTPLPTITGSQLRPVLGRWQLRWYDILEGLQQNFGWETNGKIGTINY